MKAGNNLLLDTNIVAALFNEEASVLAQFAVAVATSVSIITLGELYFGARKSFRVTEDLTQALIEYN